MQSPNTKSGSAALYALFFLSGASGLGLQMSWTRMLATGLGHEMPAVLAVVVAIFGGMAAGSWVSESVLSRNVRPGRCYGWLEVLIGFCALGSTALIPWTNQTAMALTGMAPSPGRQWLIAFAVPGLALLPATAAMGATFPAMERFLTPLVRGEACVGGLYAANTFGAVAGIVASAFWMLPTFGYTHTLAAIAVVSLICGASALVLESALGSERPTEMPAAVSGPHTTRLSLTLAATGFLGIGYEVLGVRVLAQVLENTVYTFAAVLMVFLVGTAAGAAVYQSAMRRLDPRALRPRLLAVLATTCLLGAWILAHAEVIYALARSRLGENPLGIWLAEVTTAALVFLFPTVCMGATFSHLAQSARQQRLGFGRGLALNTLGSALAPPVFGVLLLPALGAKGALVLLGLTYLGLIWPWSGFQALLAVAAILLALSLPRDLRFVTCSPGDKLVAYREGIMDSVAVLEHQDGNRTLLVNNRFTMGGTGAALAERRHGTIPLLLHPDPKRALFLGLGTGITFAAAGPHQGLRADGVELVPEIVDELPRFEPQNALPKAPDRFRVLVADARRFIQVCPETYDVIVADLFHPARDGAGALYSLEHFQAIRRRLTAQGIFCQWLPLFQLDEPMLRVVIRTFLEAFPNTRAFLLRFNVDTPVLGLVGTMQPHRYGPDYFNKRVRDPELREHLDAEQLRDAFHLFGCFLAGPEALRRYSAGAALNADDHPVVLFGALASNVRQSERPSTRLLHLLEACSSDSRELIEGDSPAATDFVRQLSGFIQARNVYLHGLTAEAEGHQDQATEDYLESARISPLFSTGYAHVLTIAMRQARNSPEAARHLLEQLATAQPDRPAARRVLERLFPAARP